MYSHQQLDGVGAIQQLITELIARSEARCSRDWVRWNDASRA